MKETSVKLELIGGVYVVETFPDGKELREEIDGDTILKVLLDVLVKAVESDRMNSLQEMPVAAPGDILRQKLANTRMEHVVRKTDRRKK